MNSPELQSEQNKVLRKIGLNVLHFQRMEAILKYLVSRSKLEGSIESLKDIHDKQVDTVSRQSMGNLVKALFTSVYSDNENSYKELTEITEAQFAFSFTVKASNDVIKQRRASLERIVQERNNLIHQMLSDFDQTSIQSCRNLNEKLDEQAERLKPEYKALLDLVQSFNSIAKQALTEFTKKTNDK